MFTQVQESFRAQQADVLALDDFQIRLESRWFGCLVLEGVPAVTRPVVAEDEEASAAMNETPAATDGNEQ